MERISLFLIHRGKKTIERRDDQKFADLTVAFDCFKDVAERIIAFSEPHRKKFVYHILAVYDAPDKREAIKMIRIKKIGVKNDAFIDALDRRTVMHGFTVNKNDISFFGDI